MSGMKILFILMIAGFIVPGLWNSVPIIKDTFHSILDPTFGTLMLWNPQIGFIIIVAILTFITTIVYKYTTDQKTLKEIKEEQKKIQEEMKKYREHPEKMMEFQKKTLDLTMKAMPITMRPAIFTIIPFIFLLKWFGDFFAIYPFKALGFMHWILGYIVFSIFLSSFIRKILKVN